MALQQLNASLAGYSDSGKANHCSVLRTRLSAGPTEQRVTPVVALVVALVRCRIEPFLSQGGGAPPPHQRLPSAPGCGPAGPTRRNVVGRLNGLQRFVQVTHYARRSATTRAVVHSPDQGSETIDQ